MLTLNNIEKYDIYKDGFMFVFLLDCFYICESLLGIFQ